MASTGLLKLTYFLQFINVIIMPILGLIASVIIIVILEVFTLGYADDAETGELASTILLIFLGIALFYLIDTIGLIVKSNLARISSILVNSALFILISTSFIMEFLNTGETDSVGVLVLSLIYFVPAATLSFDGDTKQLFK